MINIKSLLCWHKYEKISIVTKGNSLYNFAVSYHKCVKCGKSKNGKIN